MSEIFAAVLNRVMNQRTNPKNFLTELKNALYAESDLRKPSSFLNDLVNNIQVGSPDDPEKLIIQKWFIQNDGIREAEWVETTEPNTQERRDLIYRYLELSSTGI